MSVCVSETPSWMYGAVHVHRSLPLSLSCPILLPRPCPNVASGNELGSHPQATVAGRLPCPLRPAGLPLGELGGCKALGSQTEAGLFWGVSPASA